MTWHGMKRHERAGSLHTILSSMAQLPEELILSILDERFPCRQQQTRALVTLISVRLTSFSSSFGPLPLCLLTDVPTARLSTMSELYCIWHRSYWQKHYCRSPAPTAC